MYTEILGINVPIIELDNSKYVAVKDIVHLFGIQSTSLQTLTQSWKVQAITQKMERGRLVTTLYLPVDELPLFLVSLPAGSVYEELQSSLFRFRACCAQILHASLNNVCN